MIFKEITLTIKLNVLDRPGQFLTMKVALPDDFDRRKEEERDLLIEKAIYQKLTYTVENP